MLIDRSEVFYIFREYLSTMDSVFGVQIKVVSENEEIVFTTTEITRHNTE